MSLSERRALIVGIDEYQDPQLGLQAAVRDAASIATVLARHADDETNYDCELVHADARGPVTRARLRWHVEKLFDPSFDGDALFYFAGHGVLTRGGGQLVTSDGKPGDWGLAMAEVMALANASRARNLLVLLDCCHGGALASLGDGPAAPLGAIRENLTILAAARGGERAAEETRGGTFTRGVVDALLGGAADLLGDVTPQAIFRCVERRAGSWDQRPVYQSNSSRSLVVRRCPPALEKAHLRRISELFATPEARYTLDPEYELDDETSEVSEPAREAKLRISRLFKAYRDAGLLKPSVPDEQLYWVARRSHGVELTPAGKEWWYLARDGRI
jgi:hypothetical protein